ncbi:FAD-dependent monooxygenase [Rhizobium cremeum]|uniref:FAD-dependent monooxygenase n=1 Tax=Rhizobium cremeum TaxID=2813827 RepID=UPI000DE2F3D9
MRNFHEVIIVGAGPVGLWLACELRLAGVDVLVLERRTERSQQSRALTIHGRSIELFALRGLEKHFLDAGRPIPSGHFGVLDTRLDFSTFDSHFPFTLYLPQSDTEAKLEERAIELGARVLRGESVTGIEEQDGQVLVSMDRAVHACAYLVGADGARSIVRESAGIPFSGAPARHTMMLADVVLAAPPARSVLSTVNENGCAMVAPLGDGQHHRIVLVDPLRSHVARTEPVTLEEVTQSARRILGSDFGARDPIWMSRFADETRLADSYRRGRILLAGDAAHIHAPAGGQGMNVGLQDAMNLGWKLAMVVRGQAPASLLDSYGEERRPVGEGLYKNTLAQVALMTEFNPATLALRDALNGLLQIPAVNQRLAAELSGFGVRYGRTDTDVVGTDHSKAGTSVGDVELVLDDGSETTLYRLMQDGRWLDLSLQPGIRAARPGWLREENVTTISAKMKSVPPADLPMGQPVAMTIRPDGYLYAAA